MTEAEIKELIEFAYKNGWMDGICYPSTEKLNDKINDIYTRYQNDILDSKSLPSVTPQQKTGHWIKHEGWNDDTYSTEYSCSECSG